MGSRDVSGRETASAAGAERRRTYIKVRDRLPRVHGSRDHLRELGRRHSAAHTTVKQRRERLGTAGLSAIGPRT
jgi:hypothetical protein